jgi:hypothetical protein
VTHRCWGIWLIFHFSCDFIGIGKSFVKEKMYFCDGNTKYGCSKENWRIVCFSYDLPLFFLLVSICS